MRWNGLGPYEMVLFFGALIVLTFLLSSCTVEVTSPIRGCAYYTEFPVPGPDGTLVGWGHRCDYGDSLWIEPVP